MTTPAVGTTTTPGNPATFDVTIGKKKYPYTTPTMQLGPDGKTWIPKAAPGMEDLQKVSREQVSKTFDGEAFMKLLVAQLKYQDPNKPADSSQIMQQSAMLAMTEQMSVMSKSNETIASSYTSMLAEQRSASAVSLVGKNVKYTIPNPDTADTKNPTVTGEGQVDSVKFTDRGPMLMIKGKEIPLNAIDSVGAVTAPAPKEKDATTDDTGDSSTNPSTGSSGGSTA